jgi:hypothetical protein
MVDPGSEPKTDKLSILGEAIRFVQQTQLENSQLRQLNKFLEVSSTKLRVCSVFLVSQHSQSQAAVVLHLRSCHVSCSSWGHDPRLFVVAFCWAFGACWQRCGPSSDW